MEKYIITRDQSSDVPSSVLSDIYRDVTFKRQMMATRVDSVRADSKKTDDAPVWRGDHTFSSDAAKYSFLNFIEPDVAKAHPDWSKQKIRKEALTKFQQRLEQDLSYEQKESSHQETAVNWRVIETPTGTQELATEYGGETITLRQLWDHTREYAAFVGIPAAYNPDEEKAQYAMEQAFIRGDAQAYISVLSHPDAVRYVQVWEKDATGGIQSKQIDLYKTTGRDFTHTEGDVLVKHLAAFTETVRGTPVITTESSYAHFIVQSGSIQEQDIRTIAMVQATTRRESLSVYTVSDIKNKEVHEPIRAHKEVQHTFSDIQVFISEAIHKKIAQIKEEVMIKTTTGNREKNIGATSIQKIKKDVQEGNNVSSLTAVVTHAEPEERLLGEVTPIAEVFAEYVITQTALSLGSKVPEIAGGALYWLATLTEKPSLRLLSVPIGKPQTISEAMFSMMRSVRVFFEKGNEVFMNMYGRSMRSVEHGIQQDEGVTAENKQEIPHRELGFFEQIALHIQESRPDAVFVILKQLAQLMGLRSTKYAAIVPRRGADRPIPLDMRKVTVEKEASVAPVFFGIFYWIFLSYGAQSTTTRSHIVETNTHDGNIVREHQAESVHGVDQPPWVLLGIIWHLTMLREGAMTTTQQVVAQGVQTTGSTVVPQPAVPVLPLTGVIFPSVFVLE